VNVSDRELYEILLEDDFSWPFPTTSSESFVYRDKGRSVRTLVVLVQSVESLNLYVGKFSCWYLCQANYARYRKAAGMGGLAAILKFKSKAITL